MMTFSLSWLNEFVDTQDFLQNPVRLTAALTEKGFEAEGMEDLRHIISCRIDSIEKHPKADKLTVCRVWTGKENVPVVCGARNMKEGDLAVLVLPGACLPAFEEVKKTQIRGVESFGFLASQSELSDLYETAPAADPSPKKKEAEEGIWILPERSPLGLPLELLQTPLKNRSWWNDILIHVNIMPHRPDLLSHIGLAREISAVFNRPFFSEGREKIHRSFKPQSASKIALPKLSVSNRDCLRYSGCVIEGVSIAPSPLWLRRRITKAGVKSINNVVDVTNYILLEYGQPLHAFDRDKLASFSISAAPSIKGEAFTALDGKRLILTGNELTIRDGKKAVALAGVMGGEAAAVSLKTQNVFLEAAVFSKEKVQSAARRFHMETESSFRFARGVDERQTLFSLQRAADMIQTLAGGKISENFLNEGEKTPPPSPISISMHYVKERIGRKIPRFKEWMERLHCKVTDEKGEMFTVTPPYFRKDLKLKEDLLEEAARLDGYDKIPETAPKKISSLPEPPPAAYQRKAKLKQILTGHGLQETIHYSLSGGEMHEAFQKENLEDLGLAGGELIFVENPLTSGWKFMRPLLLADIFKTAVYNFRHSVPEGEIFEAGPVFYKKNNQFIEEERVAAAVYGKPCDLWRAKGAPAALRLKSQVERLLKRLKIQEFSFAPPKQAPSFMHPRETLLLTIKGERAGFIGSLHPLWKLKYKILTDFALGEFALRFFEEAERKFVAPPPALNAVERDLTFVLPPAVPAGRIAKEILNILLRRQEFSKEKPAAADRPSVQMIAMHKMEQKKAISYRFRLPCGEKPWTDKALLDIQQNIIAQVENKFSVSLK